MTPNDKLRLFALHAQKNFDRNQKVKISGASLAKMIDTAGTLIEAAEEHYEKLESLYGERPKKDKPREAFEFQVRGRIW